MRRECMNVVIFYYFCRNIVKQVIFKTYNYYGIFD